MKKLGLVAIGLILCSLQVQAEMINTWEGGTASWYSLANGGAVSQRFTVPAGQTGTEVKMWAEKHGSFYQTPGYYTHIVLYPAGSNSSPIALKSYQWTDPYWNDVTGAYLTVSDTPLALAPGEYDIQMWCNTEWVNNLCFVPLYSGSTYSGGYAVSGWAGGDPLGDGMDFQAQVTMVPEPAALSLIGLGAMAWIRRRS